LRQEHRTLDCSAYIDIETTGLSPHYNEITVVGICVENRSRRNIIQLVGGEISAEALGRAVRQANTIYTYNGSRFDLKFIQARLGIDLASLCRHKDLMYNCWKQNLYGGLKSVENQLGIARRLWGMDGKDAVRLWYDHLSGDEKALSVLLEYNREDVLNLITLRGKLGI
jgi:uncharacterized protein